MPTDPNDDPNNDLSDLLLTMARSMVDNSDVVRVETARGDRAVLLTLHVADSDVGKVIGRGGANANALRTILTAAAGAMRLRVTLEIPAPVRERRFA